MLPFDSYLGGGRSSLGKWKNVNTRRVDGPEFMRLTGQRNCAYCDIDLAATYESWLTMVLDHVVPVSLCEQAGFPGAWCWDFSNAVLACAACNGFCNRYAPSVVTPPTTLEAFFDLRDRIFTERKALITARHAVERELFHSKPWDGPTSSDAL